MSGLRGGRRHGGARETARDSGTGDGRRVVVTMAYHDWQFDVRRALIGGAKVIVMACGARSGKDRGGNMMGLELMHRKAAARLEAEKRGAQRMIPRVNCWMVAPTDKLWQQNWDEFLAFIPPVLIVEKNKQAGLIRLRGDIVIKFKSADRPEMLVSEGLDFLIVTEASRVRDGKVWYESLLPRLSSPGRDGVAMLNGTPKVGKGHWYRQVWEKAKAFEEQFYRKHGTLDGCSMRQWKLPSSCNPEMTESVLRELQAQMTDRAFRSEILAEWPDEDEKPFRDSDIDAMDVTSGITESGVVPEKPARGYVKALDIARRKDETFCVCGVPGVGTVEGRDLGEEFHPAEVVDGFRLVGKRLSYQIAKCVEMEKRYPGEWIVDGTGTGGQYFIDQMREAMPGVRVTDFHFGYDSKVELCEGLEYGVEKRGLVIRRDLCGAKLTDELKRQLSIFECEITDKNRLNYHGPGGKEDDGTIALGLFWSKVQYRGARVDNFNHAELLAKIFG